MKFTISILLLLIYPAFAFAQNELAVNNPADKECEKYCILDLGTEQEETIPAEPSNASVLIDAGALFLPGPRRRSAVVKVALLPARVQSKAASSDCPRACEGSP